MKIIHINKTVIFHLLIISGLVFGQNNSCIECHSQLGGNLAKPVEGYKNDKICLVPIVMAAIPLLVMLNLPWIRQKDF